MVVITPLGISEGFSCIVKLIMKKVLNIHNTLGSWVNMEYNGNVNNIIRGV